jgi:uncharacterized protein (DUF427 family)
MSSTERGRVRAEPSAKRLRAFLDGQVVVDTIHPLLVWEIPYYPYYYVPRADLRAELVATGKVTRSPSRGDGHHYDVKLPDGTTAADAAVTYPESPLDAVRDYVRLEWSAMSAWFEEDEEVFTHPRSPYTRVDILPTSRHVEVRLGDVVLADTTRAHALFETGLPTRWYVPRVDVRMDLLTDSDTITHCPYKGQASHYSARIGDETTADVAWSYPTPLPESERIAGLLAFYDTRVTVLVDDEPVNPR